MPKEPEPEVTIMPVIEQSAAEIYVKVFPFSSSPINSEEFAGLITRTDGYYCEKVVDGMTAVSGQALCGSGNSNLGFYFRTRFPVGQDGSVYSFRTPTDFGLGG